MRHALFRSAFALLFPLCAVTAGAAETELYRFAEPAVQALVRSNDDQHRENTIWLAAPGKTGLGVTCRPGAGYPGVKIRPETPQDLSAYGYLEARVENLGDAPLFLVFRIDGGASGEPRINEDGVTLAGYAKGSIRIPFGTSWGKPGHPSDPGHITQFGLYVVNPTAEIRFRVESFVAGRAP